MSNLQRLSFLELRGLGDFQLRETDTNCPKFASLLYPMPATPKRRRFQRYTTPYSINRKKTKRKNLEKKKEFAGGWEKKQKKKDKFFWSRSRRRTHAWTCVNIASHAHNPPCKEMHCSNSCPSVKCCNSIKKRFWSAYILSLFMWNCVSEKRAFGVRERRMRQNTITGSAIIKMSFI